MNTIEITENIEESITLLEYVKEALAEYPDLPEHRVQEELKKAYQFLNLAWNARDLTKEQYLALCADEAHFQEMGSFPHDIGLSMLEDNTEED